MSAAMTSAETLSIHPMPIGAEVHGLPLDPRHGADVRDILYRAWLEHGVLVFRDIDSIERHLALSECFGELEIHPFAPARSEEHPLLIELGGGKRRRAYVFDETEVRINRIAWHRDTAYTPDICKGSMLRMVDAPFTEGETLFADTARAYDDLPQRVKDRLEGLEFKATLRIDSIQAQGRPGTFWKKARPATDEEDPLAPPDKSDHAAAEQRFPPVVHPAVLVHPESGRKCIFLSPTYVDFFLGLETQESDDLLAYLTDHMLNSKYVYKHRWSANDAVLWDNRRVVHAGMGNRVDEPRRALRTTLAGPVRTGRYFEDVATTTGPLLVD
jgi:taurine dioxygenase